MEPESARPGADSTQPAERHPPGAHPGIHLRLLFAHANGWAVAILMFSGASDWADGKIARTMNQSSRLGVLLDPAVDRLYMVTVPIVLALSGIVPWWFVITLLARDGLLAATLPLLRSRGLSALPVTYVGKGATFALMSGFPLVLLGTSDALWSRVMGACRLGLSGLGYVSRTCGRSSCMPCRWCWWCAGCRRSKAGGPAGHSEGG